MHESMYVYDAGQGKFPQGGGERSSPAPRKGESFGREHRKNPTRTPNAKSKESLLEEELHSTDKIWSLKGRE